MRGIDPKDLGTVVPFPWKPGAGRTVAECCFHPYWNMVYHQGQIACTVGGNIPEVYLGVFAETPETTTR